MPKEMPKEMPMLSSPHSLQCLASWLMLIQSSNVFFAFFGSHNSCDYVYLLHHVAVQGLVQSTWRWHCSFFETGRKDHRSLREGAWVSLSWLKIVVSCQGCFHLTALLSRMHVVSTRLSQPRQVQHGWCAHHMCGGPGKRHTGLACSQMPDGTRLPVLALAVAIQSPVPGYKCLLF
jgi:hypothetical protein